MPNDEDKKKPIRKKRRDPDKLSSALKANMKRRKEIQKKKNEYIDK